MRPPSVSIVSTATLLLACSLLASACAARAGDAAGGTCDPAAPIGFAMYGDSLCDGPIEPCDVLDGEPAFRCLNRCNAGYATSRPIDPEDPFSAVVPLLLDDLETGVLDPDEIDYVVIAAGANDVRPGDWQVERDFDVPLRLAVSALLEVGIVPFLTVTHPQYETQGSGYPDCTPFHRNATRIEAVMRPTIEGIAADQAPPLPVIDLYAIFQATPEGTLCPGVFDHPDGIYRDHVHVTFGKGNEYLTAIYRRALRSYHSRHCPAAGAGCSVEPTEESYAIGETLAWERLDFENGTDQVIPNVRLVSELRREGALAKRLVDAGPLMLAVGWTLHAGGAGFVIPEGMPPGSWSMRCALEDFATGTVLAEDEAPFEIGASARND